MSLPEGELVRLAPSQMDADQVRFEFERGRLFALESPLLPLLLLAENGAEWVESGLRTYLRAQMDLVAPGAHWDAVGEASLTVKQYEGPFTQWARSLLVPGDWETLAKVDRVMRRGRTHDGRAAFGTAYDVALAAGVSPWPALVRLIRRLRTGPRKRALPPAHGLVALEQLLGMEVGSL